MNNTVGRQDKTEHDALPRPINGGKPRTVATRMAWILTGIVVFLLAIHLFLQYLNLNIYHEYNGFVFELSNRFDMDDEISVPTWFAQTLLFVVSMGAMITALIQTQRARRRLWTVVGVIALLLSIDEGASMHELALQSLHNIFFRDAVATVSQNAWWVAAPVAILFAGLLLWQSIRLLPRRTVMLFAAGGTVYILGAAIIDLLAAATNNAFWHQGVMVAIEESMELIGTIIVFYAILNYLEASHYERLKRAFQRLELHNK